MLVNTETLPPRSRLEDAAPKITGKIVVASLLRRLLNPWHLIKAVWLQIRRKAHRHAFDDAQLALYAKVLPTDFLHFGYFDDPSRRPEDIGLSEIGQAQLSYAEQLLKLVIDPAAPVLDVGCGMGGLCRMLKDRGFTPVALTPDRLQASHIRTTLSDVGLIRCKLEALDAAAHPHRFGTIITAESLQYLKLPQALPVLEGVLRPGGRWIACDFFHSQPSQDRSCHVWADFQEKLAETGWKITYERDITPHVLPMLAYIHMWATRFGVPLMQFAFLRLRRKNPGAHYLASGALEALDGLATANIALIDPAQFAARKRYMLLVMQRA